jgi:hypothetical protein
MNLAADQRAKLLVTVGALRTPRFQCALAEIRAARIGLARFPSLAFARVQDFGVGHLASFRVASPQSFLHDSFGLLSRLRDSCHLPSFRAVSPLPDSMDRRSHAQLLHRA